MVIHSISYHTFSVASHQEQHSNFLWDPHHRETVLCLVCRIYFAIEMLPVDLLDFNFQKKFTCTKRIFLFFKFSGNFIKIFVMKVYFFFLLLTDFFFLFRYFCINDGIFYVKTSSAGLLNEKYSQKALRSF